MKQSNEQRHDTMSEKSEEIWFRGRDDEIDEDSATETHRLMIEWHRDDTYRGMIYK